MRNTNMRALAAVVAIAMSTVAVPARAAIILKTLDVTGSNFVLFGGDGSVLPVDPLHLNVTVNFDNSASFLGATSGFTVNSFDLPYALQMSYDSSFDLLQFSTNPIDFNVCQVPANSFCAFISGISTGSPHLGGMAQGTSVGGFWIAAAVPEPATWALMLVGFLGIGGAMRAAKRKERVSVSYAKHPDMMRAR